MKYWKVEEKKRLTGVWSNLFYYTKMRKKIEFNISKLSIKTLRDWKTEKSISDVLKENTIKEMISEWLITMKNKQSNLLCISFLDPALVKGVTTCQYTIKKYQPDQKLRFLSSYWACPCVIMTFYDPLEMKWGIAHLTVDTSVDKSLEDILSHFDNLYWLQIFVCWWSDMEESKELVDNIYNFLNSRKLYYYSRAFSERWKQKGVPEVEWIALDILTWHIYDSVPTSSVKTYISEEFEDTLIEI